MTDPKLIEVVLSGKIPFDAFGKHRALDDLPRWDLNLKLFTDRDVVGIGLWNSYADPCALRINNCSYRSAWAHDFALPRDKHRNNA